MNRFVLILLFLISIHGSGQDCNKWNWPEDRLTAEEKWALFSDNLRDGIYPVAKANFYWLLEHVPALNKALYINGVKLYSELSVKEEDPDLQRIYADSAITLYNVRMEVCSENGDLYNRKAFDAYRFYRNDETRYLDLIAYFRDAIEHNGNEVWLNNLGAYMDIARKSKLAGLISDERVIKIYDEVSGMLDQIEDTNAERIKETAEKIFISTVEMDCDLIREKFVSNFEQDPDNLELGKKIIGLSVAFKCTTRDYFLSTARQVFELEPKFKLGELIADRSFGEGRLATATAYYHKALDLAPGGSDKADIYMKLFSVSLKKGEKQSAREYAYKGLEADPSRKEIHSLIGNLYFASYNECRKGVDKVKDRLVFIAAYEQYKLAGDTENMQKAREQFPSKEEVFLLKYEVGQRLMVDCWIREAVKIQTRD